MEAQPNPNLPYFDLIFDELSSGNEGMEAVFGHHVHWGYWSEPGEADGTIADFQSATAALSRLVWTLAPIEEGDHVLEVGCGFGGTADQVNREVSGVSITGLNIDRRQLVRAMERVVPAAGNAIHFVQGDACALTFADASFDHVLAVECVFHFEDKPGFFEHAARVLKPGGILAFSDFLAADAMPGFVKRHFERHGFPFYGALHLTTLAEYRALAERLGFEIVAVHDVNRNTFPTFPIVKGVFSMSRTGRVMTTVAEVSQKVGLLQYHVIGMRRR